MNIAITGGTGFIGRHLVARHIAQGDEVRCLTRGSPANMPSGAKAYLGNLTKPETLVSFVDGADVLYHCAAELRETTIMEKTNVVGTANLLNAAEGRVGRWVQLSSTGLYGALHQGVVCEDAEILPSNPYECSKAAADALVLEAASKRNFPCVVLRPSNVYGADMPNKSLFQMIRMIDKGLFFFIGPRGTIANYIHVENVVDALLLCSKGAPPSNGRSYIVSDHCTLEELVNVLASQLGTSRPNLRLPYTVVRGLAQALSWLPMFPLKVSRVEALTNRTIYLTNRIEEELGYRNRVTLEMGMSDLVKAYKQCHPQI